MIFTVGCIVVCLIIVSIVATVTLLQDISYQLADIQKTLSNICGIIATKLDCKEEYARIVQKQNSK